MLDFLTYLLLWMAIFGSAYDFCKLVRKVVLEIKSKKRRKKPSEIEREVDEILREHIG